VKEPGVDILPAVPPSEFPVPAMIAAAGDKASEHFLEFFAGDRTMLIRALPSSMTDERIWRR